MSYASVASKASHKPQSNNHATPGQTSEARYSKSTKRSPSPAHVPKTGSPERDTYVLTLMTDKGHHARLTKMREQYFPKKINKLAAHLTLFHALPGSKVDTDIIPILQKVATANAAFEVRAGKAFRLKRGIAIDVAEHEGGAQAHQIHKALQQPWRRAGFLSEQDAGGCRVHYTIMNKVDDAAEVDMAFKEMAESWKGDWGTVEGLGLWRYDRGFWHFKQKFDFQPQA